MKIVLFPHHAHPRTLNTQDWRFRWRLVAGILAALLLAALIGAGVALILANPRAVVVARIQNLQQSLTQQKRTLAQVQLQAQRDITALTQQVGLLKAQAIRLDALGSQLVQSGHLKSDEFNFDQEPAMGGPELDASSTALPPTLANNIHSLGVRFKEQQTQLSMLSHLLRSEQLYEDLMPAGMPVHTGYISSYFGYRADPFNGSREFHSGLDIAVPIGTKVHAVAEGIVTYVGQRHGYGNVVEVDHGNGYMTRYAHNSKLLVHVGQRVHIGQVLSLTGDTGRSTGPHLHFEVWKNDRVINPLAFVKRHRGHGS